MKTFVVQLESHDDIISARDKISWNKSPRVLVIWPPEGSILTTRLDVILLQRVCKQMGAQIGVVSTNRPVQEHARDLRIPVFSSADEAQLINWRRARGRRGGSRKISRMPRDISVIREMAIRGEEKRISPLMRWLAFLIGITAFASIMLFFLPGAKITIPADRIKQEMVLPVWSSPEIQQTNITGGIPSRLKSIIVEGRVQKSTSGTINIADTRAEGTARFTNLTDKLVIIPAGTIVSTRGANPIRFTTTREIQVEGGSGKVKEVPVIAILAGESGNITAWMIEAVEGTIGLQVTATNTNAFQGGRDLLMPAPNEQDITQLRDQLMADLRKTALAELLSKPDQSELVITPSLREKQIISEYLEPLKDQPGETLNMKLRVEFEVWIVSMSDLLSVSKVALDTSMPVNYQPLGETLSVQKESEPIIDEMGFARWSIKTERTLKKIIPADHLADWVLGKPVPEGISVIQTKLGLESPPKVERFPSWWSRMPWLPFRIDVELH